ncbi:VanZ family protein [Cellulomonas sp. NS3]|uniref:VanZ family protein n=1 Tax=Cellulomonas sp. NS3 TaxID=2973977 RepID=UPI0021630A31|nr:VanZ family protein [Cellulomonas sp. NS3]
MQQYLHVFGGLIAVLALVAGACGVALALLGARAVRAGGTWSSYLARVGPRVAFAVLCLGTAFATLTPAGTRDGRAIDLVPLRTALAAGMTTTTPTQIAGNLALLFWLGLLLPAVSSRRWSVLRITAVVAATSAVIEAAQYVLGLGRVSAVDDVLLNTLGGGVAAVLGVHLLAPRVRRHRTAASASEMPSLAPSDRRILDA